MNSIVAWQEIKVQILQILIEENTMVSSIAWTAETA